MIAIVDVKYIPLLRFIWEKDCLRLYPALLIYILPSAEIFAYHIINAVFRIIIFRTSYACSALVVQIYILTGCALSCFMCHHSSVRIERCIYVLCLRGLRRSIVAYTRYVQLRLFYLLLFVAVASLFITDDAAVLDSYNSLVHLVYDVLGVCDHQDCGSSYVDLLEELHDLHSSDRVEVTCRLVADENSRLVHEGSCDTDSLLLAS